MLSHTFRVRLVCLAALIALGGCAASPEFVNTAIRPGKFKLYTCAELDQQGRELAQRERELQTLMQKAGGELAVALAYQNEYNLTQGELRDIDNTGSEKKCVLKYRTVSERAVR
jgi:hypothetical protein